MLTKELISKGRFWSRAWSLIDGCTHVSEGCDNCWLASMAHRFKQDFSQVCFREDRLDIPLRIKKPTVFAIWSDLYHEKVTDEQIGKAVDVMVDSPQHTFLIVTKRPERPANIGISFPDNVYHLITCENQQRFDERILYAMQILGKTGLLIEPMLGPIGLMFGEAGERYSKRSFDLLSLRNFFCVIVGGETGPKARPIHPDWVRSVRDQCASAEVPFFFKSWGEWFPEIYLTEDQKQTFWQKKNHQWGCLDRAGNWFAQTTAWNGWQGPDSPEGEYIMYRIGKKNSGRILDGRTHDDLPWRGK